MEELDVPIFKKAYELYKAIHGLRSGVPKQDRYTLWQRVEETALACLENLLSASQRREGRREPLEDASVDLNLLRVFLRLAKDTKVLDLKKYVSIELTVDEIGRMLGGWLKSLPPEHRQPPPPEESTNEGEKEVPSRRQPHVVVAVAIPVVVDVQATVVPVQFGAIVAAGLRGAPSLPYHCGLNDGNLSAALHSGAASLSAKHLR